MNKRIRFHLDENIHPAIAVGLRRYGIDVTTTVEIGLRGKSDRAQLEFVLKRRAIAFQPKLGMLSTINFN